MRTRRLEWFRGPVGHDRRMLPGTPEEIPERNDSGPAMGPGKAHQSVLNDPVMGDARLEMVAKKR